MNEILPFPTDFWILPRPGGGGKNGRVLELFSVGFTLFTLLYPTFYPVISFPSYRLKSEEHVSYFAGVDRNMSKSEPLNS